MMKKFIYIVSALSLVVSSCTSEIENVKTEAQKEYAPLVLNVESDEIEIQDPSTRAVGVFSYTINWQPNDEISIINSDKSQTTTLVFDGTVNSTIGKFKQKEGDETVWSGTITGYYPKELLNDNTLKWPSVQKWNNSFTGMPMALTANVDASNESTTFQFGGLGGAIQGIWTTTEPDVIVDYITVEAENAGLSGAFEITDGIAKNFQSGTTVTIDCSENGLNLSEGFKNVFFQLPVITNPKLTFTLYARDGRIGTTESTASIRHKILNRMPRVISNFGYILIYAIDNVKDKITSHTPFVNVDYTTFNKQMIQPEQEEYPEPISLTYVELPSTVETLGEMTFIEESSLATIKLNEGLISIGDNCFEGCTALTTIDIPSTVTEMGSNVFYGCENLATVIFRGENPPTFGQDIDLIPWAADLTIYVPDASVSDYENVLYSYPNFDEIEIKGLSEFEE